MKQSNSKLFNYEKNSTISVHHLVCFASLYIQRTGQTQAPGQRNIDHSSGFFISPGFKYDIMQRPSGFKLSFSAGPSLQLGGEGYLANINYFNQQGEPQVVSFINSYQRIGIFAELEAEWKTKNPNVRNAASISATGFDNYLRWYFHATYKVRFGIGKK